MHRGHADGFEVLGALGVEQPAVGVAGDVELLRVDGLDQFVEILEDQRFAAGDDDVGQPQLVRLTRQIPDVGDGELPRGVLALKVLDRTMLALEVADVVVLELDDRDAFAALDLLRVFQDLFVDVRLVAPELFPFGGLGAAERLIRLVHVSSQKVFVIV